MVRLRECVEFVFKKKEKLSLVEMLLCKLKLLIDILKKWLRENFFQRFSVLNVLSKQNFRRENLINWAKKMFNLQL